MKNLKWIILSLIIIFIFSGVIIFYWPEEGSGPSQLITIKPQTSTWRIASLLSRKGIIKNKVSFFLLAKMKGDNLQAGEYELKPSMKKEEILNKIIKGEVFAWKVTIPEGYTASQIAELLEEMKLCQAEKFISQVLNPTFKRDTYRYIPREGSLEGFLFPDTYYITKGRGEEAIIKMMLSCFEEVVPSDLKERAEKLGLSVQELITLASLIEKEAKDDLERALIGGVLLNRLNIGMRLQCDATVQYALPHRKSRLTYSDLKIESPYNTYLHLGLPPGPIANPGLPSIEEAASPAKTNYFFYVAKPDGTHIFTETYQEHLQAIEEVQREREKLRGQQSIVDSPRSTE